MAALKLKGYDRANTNFSKDQYHHEPFMIVRPLSASLSLLPGKLPPALRLFQRMSNCLLTLDVKAASSPGGFRKLSSAQSSCAAEAGQ